MKTPKKLFDRLSSDLLQVLESTQNCDVLIKVGDNDDIEEEEFPVHSLLLSARSPYFRAALSKDWQKLDLERNNLIVLKKPNISPRVFKLVLRYIYTGILDFSDQEIFDVLDLLVAADELILDELIEHVQDYLIQNHADWLQQNIVRVLHTIFQHQTCKKLQDYCLEIISNDPKFLFESEDYFKLESNIIMVLLERDDLEMEEIELWDYMIKWGMAQFNNNNNNNAIVASGNSNNNNNNNSYESIVEKWEKKDFVELEKILNKCIPLIRYFHISGDDYFKKVFPFKRILPKSLKKDLYGYFLSTNYRPKSIILPPRISPIDSIIITNKHALIIELWMEKHDLIASDNDNNSNGDSNGNNNNNNNNNGSSSSSSSSSSNSNSNNNNSNNSNNIVINDNEPIINCGKRSRRLDYDWNLLFRASRDGFTSDDFHSKCDNKGGSCVVLIRMSGRTQIIGGYNPVGWYTSKRGYYATDDSFIFSMNFDGKKDFENCCRLNRVKNNKCAIYQDPSRGPTFGYPDLSVSDRCNENSRSNYEPRPYYLHNDSTHIPSFYVDDYEIFQVVKSKKFLFN